MKIIVRQCRICGSHKEHEAHYIYGSSALGNRRSWCNACANTYYKKGVEGPVWRESMQDKWRNEYERVKNHDTDIEVEL